MCKYFRPWTAAHQAPLSLGFPKQEYWSRSTELDRVGHQPSTKPSFWTENNSIILRCNYGDSKRTLNINVLNKALSILSMGKCGFSICKGFVYYLSPYYPGSRQSSKEILSFFLLSPSLCLFLTRQLNAEKEETRENARQQFFSNLSLHQNHLEDLIKLRLLSSTLEYLIL